MIELLKKNHDLSELDLCFVKSANESKSALSALKKQVNETFEERFKARNLEFRVEIHRTGDQYVRYVLKEKPIEQDGTSRSRIFNFIKRVEKHKKEREFE